MPINPYDDAVEELPPAPAVTVPVDPAAHDAALEALDHARQRPLRQSLTQAAGTNPQRAADVQRLSQRLGMPADVVERNFDAIQKRATQIDTPYSQMLRETPHLADWAAEPANAKVAHDDLAQLGALEWLVTAPQRAYAQAHSAARQGELSFTSMFRALTQDEQDEHASATYHATLGGELGADTWFRKAIVGAGGFLANQEAALKYGLVGAAEAGAAGAVVGSVVPGIGTAAGALAGAGYGARAGMLYGVLKSTAEGEAGHAWEELQTFRDEHGQPLDPAVAKIAALAIGGLNAPIEAWGFGKVVESIPGLRTLGRKGITDAVKHALRTQTVRSALYAAAKSYGSAMGAEVAQEVAQRGVAVLGEELAKAASNGGKVDGQLAVGTVNLYAQPKVANADGSVSTVDSLSVNLDGREILLPTVTPDGRHFTGPGAATQAIAEYERTGQHLGVFASPAAATKFATRLHEDYASGVYDHAGPRRTGAEIVADLVNEGSQAALSFSLALGIGPALGLKFDARRAQRATQNVGFFEALGASAKDSKTIARQPAAAQAFLERATKDGPVATLYAPVDTWDQYWQSQKLDPAMVYAEVTGNATGYALAVAEGRHLEIPTAAYAVKLAGSEHNGFLAHELKLGPDEMNAREAAAFTRQVAALPTVAPDVAADEVHTAVLAQLERAGLTGTTAEHYATLHEATFRSLAARNNLAAVDLFRAYGLQVQRPDLEALRARAGVRPGSAAAAATATPEAPAAVFLAHAPDGPLYNVVGGDADGSTVSAARLAELGIAVPETPAPVAGEALSGDELRRLALDAAGPRAEAIIARLTDQAPIGASVAAAATPTVDPDAPIDLRNPVAAAAAMRRENPRIDKEAQQLADRSRDTRTAAPPRVSSEGSHAQNNATDETRAGDEHAAREQSPLDAIRLDEGPGDGGRVEPRRFPPPDVDEQFVRQDPAIVDARLTPEVHRELAHILDELETFPFVERTWHWLGATEGKTGNAAGGDAEILAGGAGAAVYHDILALAPVNPVTSGRRKGQLARNASGSRGKVEAAIRAVLATRTVATNLAEGALRVAERRAADEWHDLSAPELPRSWGREASRSFTDALAAQIDAAVAPEADLLGDETAIDETALDAIEGSTSIDELNQGLFDDLEPGAAAADGQVDTLDTGEQQPRLPGAGDVREQNVQTPTFDAPFSLTSEVAKPKGKQTTLFQSVYHGTRHAFEAFSLHAIGSGEGAQAYGWGLYFASVRDVADRYREALAGKAEQKHLAFKSPDDSNILDGPVFQTGGLFNNEHNSLLKQGLLELYSRVQFMPAGPEGLAKLREELTRTIANYARAQAEGRTLSLGKTDPELLRADRYRQREAELALEALDHYGAQLEIRPPMRPGRTYTVEIPEDEDFLSWDKPLAEQSPKVQAALTSLGFDLSPVRYPTFAEARAKINAALIAPDTGGWQRVVTTSRELLLEGLHYATTENTPAFRAWWAQHGGQVTGWGDIETAPMTGEDAYRALAERHAETVTINSSVGPYSGTRANTEAASKALNALGVAGIRYLDGSSRAAGEGTSNYVVFDEKLVAITEFDQPLAPMFYSRLTRAVEESKQAKASGAQWKATIKNSKAGINLEEFALASVGDLVDGQSYTRQEVLDYLALNQVEVEQVLLGGGPAVSSAEITEEAEKRYDEAVDRARNEAEGNMPEFYSVSTSAEQHPDDETIWYAVVDGERQSEEFDSEEAAQEAADEFADEQRDRQEKDYWEEWDHGVSYDAIYDDVREELEADNEGSTHFDAYVEPGAEAGSYREVFLTAPKGVRGAATFDPELVELERHTTSTTQGTTVLRYAGQTIERYGDDPKLQPDGTYQQRAREHWIAVARRVFDSGDKINRIAQIRKGWVDGHEDYDAIHNPIVRIRLNTRVAVDGSRVLFLEEVQPPHEDEQAKMPALFVKSWRALAFKWALQHATEQGLDAVAWTTGAMQADRYSLEKQVRSIEWGPMSEADHRALPPGHPKASPTGQFVVIDLPTGLARLNINAEGEITRTAGVAPTEWLERSIADVIGKEVATKIGGAPEGKLVGEGLKIGGEGLKRLYDVDFKSVVNSLPAVKKLGAKVEILPVSTRGTALHRPVTIREVPAGPNAARYFVLLDGAGVSVGDSATREEAEARIHAAANGEPVQAIRLTRELVEAIGAGQSLFQPEQPGRGLDPVALRTFELEVRAAAGERLRGFSINLTAAGDIDLAMLVVERGAQGAGLGTDVMQQLTAFADTHGVRVTLSPTSANREWGTTSRGRLVRFYRRFGFVENAGRRKDFALSASMYREPTVRGALPVAPPRQTDTPAFRNWFKESAVRDAAGAPLRVYHGAQRLDRFGPVLKKGRATSGPMPFFTTDTDIASNYAKNKGDTSLAPEDGNYNAWFRLRRGRRQINLDRAWWHLTPAQRALVAERAPRVTTSEDGQGRIELGPDGHTTATGGYDQHIKEARGNHFAALIEEWLNSGNLFNDERAFLTVLSLAGAPVDAIEFHDPQRDAGGIAPVYLSIQRPLVTSQITDTDIEALERASKRTRVPVVAGVDAWDKTSVAPSDWIARLKEDRASGTNSHAWSSIPDWVTKALRGLGYDGIHDTGGKMGGAAHDVWIPFEPGQVKSAIGNRGTFDPQSANMLAQPDDTPTGRRGSIRFGPDRQFIINLFERADLSTFLHESGHFFLEVLQDLAKRDDAPAQTRADVQTLRAWFFPEGDTGQIIGVDEHEQFARGFERYLMEGQAPSLELRGAFAAFSAWLGRIYRSLTGLNVDLTPEVREVMTRLLATENELEDAAAAGKVAPMFLTPGMAGMTEAAFGLYAGAISDASRTAREQLQTKLLAEVSRVQAAAWRQQQDDIRDVVTRELQARPVYRALSAMQRGTLPDGSQLLEGLDSPPLKLSKAIIVDRYGAERLAALPRPFIYVKEGGWDPDTVAEMFGFSSGDALLQAVSEAPPLRTAIEQEAGNRMLEEHGSLLLDGDALAKAAQAALANDDRDRIIRMELKALNELRRTVSPFVKQAQQGVDAALEEADRERAYERRWMEAETRLRIAIAEGKKQTQIEALAGEVKQLRAKARGGAAAINAALPSLALLRETAVARMAATRVRDIKPTPFWTASRQAAQIAIEKAARQDYDGAIAAKVQELTNLALYRAAQGALEDVDARVQRAKDMGKPAARKRIGLAGRELLEQVDDVLDRYEFAPATGKAIARRQSLRKFVAGLEAQGLPVDLPDELLDDARRIHYSELTLDELVGVTDGLQMLAHLVRLTTNLLAAADEREFDAVRGALVASIHDHNKTRDTKLEIGAADKRTRTIGEWFASHTKLTTFIARLDGYADGGAAWNAIMRPLNVAATRQAAMHAAAGAALEKILSTAYSGRALAHLADKMFIPAIGASLTHEARIAVALNWGNAGNRQRLMESRRNWNEHQVQAILDTLDARDLRFVQETLDYINTYWPEIAAKQERVFGIAPEKVDAAGWTHATLGEQRGGYYPIAYDGRLSVRAGNVIDANANSLEQHASYAYATTKRGHTKAREEKVNQPVRLELSVAWEHLERVIHDLSHHETLIDIGRLLADRQVQDAIAGTVGDQVYKQIRNTVLDVALGAQHATTVGNRALNFVRNGTTISGLGWNFWTTLLQPIGVVNGMARIGPKWVGRGLSRFLRDASTMEYSARWVHEKSEMMRLRGDTANRDIAELRGKLTRAGGWFETALRTVSGDRVTQEDITDSFLWSIEKAQSLADLPVWIGGYEKAMAAGETEERAVALADQGVLDSQSGGQIKDLAEVQRGTPAFKLFTSFYSFGNLMFNQTARAVGETDFKRIGSIGQFLGNLSLLYIVPAVFQVAMAHAVGKSGDEDNPLAELGEELLASALNTMVLVRELAGAARSVYGRSTGLSAGTRGYEGPTGLRIVSAIGSLAQQMQQGVADRPLLRAAEDVAGILFQLPLARVHTMVDGAVALYEGRTHNPAALLVGPPPKPKGAR